MKRSTTGSFAVLLTALALCAPAPAAAQEGGQEGDAARGAVLGMTCLGCHGIPGYRNAYPSYRVPKLGGQRPEYVKAALEAYRSGTRPHPTMHAQGSSLSDQDIADIAAWIGSLGTAQDDVAADDIEGLDAAQTCITCHSVAGAAMTPAPPVLSGQHRDYLEHALQAYREQARNMPVMNAQAAALSDEDIEKLAEFWSSRQGLHTLRAGEQTEAPDAP